VVDHKRKINLKRCHSASSGHAQRKMEKEGVLIVCCKERKVEERGGQGTGHSRKIGV
jgi:hypothetical protein